MKIYINGLSAISPQPTFEEANFLEQVLLPESNRLRCVEPDYKTLLDPNQVRRMPRVIRMGLATALQALQDAGLQQVDAILSATALGCLQATERFLQSIDEEEEHLLAPTPFIQSTYNVVSAQIAQQLGCTGYNFTFTHKGFSFEQALTNASLLLQEGRVKNILLGGHDEQTDRNWSIYDQFNHWKKGPIPVLTESTTPGTISGEGAAFFVVSNQSSERTYARLDTVATLYKPSGEQEVRNWINAVLEEQGVAVSEIDFVLYGINGVAPDDKIYHHLRQGLFAEQSAGYFKHLCGEYQTASSFALWLAARILQEQQVPTAIRIQSKAKDKFSKILIYNHYRNSNQAMYLLSKV